MIVSIECWIFDNLIENRLVVKILNINEQKIFISALRVAGRYIYSLSN